LKLTFSHAPPFCAFDECSWNNEFPEDPLSPNSYKDNLHFGDLVTMTIVDVFETDCDGKLLSYCPTFDNRAVYKTAQRVERIRKSSTMIKKNMNIVASSPAAARVNKVRGFVNIFLWSKMMIEFVANH
jgi:hypothetical protein